MKPRLCTAIVVGLVIVLLAGGGASVSAQPVASIALPPPRGTVQLYPGCNNIALSFPDGTDSQAVLNAVTPAGVVQTMWRHNAAQNKFEGFSPAAPQASDLLSVNRWDAVWLCVAAAPSPVVDPCALLTSLEGQPLRRGPSFALNVNVKWQLCLGGMAAGSGEKYLFHTNDAEASWKLISQTTLGNPTPQAGVGQLPNGNGVTQILFLDATHGWMGLNSPGVNLFRSQDGGVTWTPVTVIPSAVPVTSITFTDSQHGTVVTPEGNWTTSDGGVTWTH